MSYCILYRDYSQSLEAEATLKREIKQEYDEENPDIVIALGGDGTIIRAVHTYPNALIFGLNAGHLGYYCKYKLEDINTLIEDINTNGYRVEEIPVLESSIYNNDELILNALSINEAVVLSPLKALYLEVRINNEALEHFKGNGLCFSTAYGSTGFNRSLNGALVDRDLSIIQITEIAGINSTAYKSLNSPLIINGNKEIEIEPLSDSPFLFSVDNIQYDIDKFTKLKISYKGNSIRVAYHKDEGFIRRINRAFIND